MKTIQSLFLVALLNIDIALGVTYKTNRCLCQLDPHLFAVRQNLRIGNTYPSTPNPDVTTPMPQSANKTSTTAAATEAVNETSGVNATDSSTSTTSAPPSGRRKKRETNVADNNSPNYEKCGEESWDKGVLTPVKEDIVSYDKTIRLSVCDGVSYTWDYNASLCNCTVGTTARLSLCFLNVKYTTDFDNSASDVYRAHINRLLPWVDGTFEKSAIKSIYMRTVPEKFTSFRDDAFLQVHFIVTLNTRVASPVYEINSGFETKELLNGRFTIDGFRYETEIENQKGCYKIKDTTAPEPTEPPILGKYRYAFLGAGCGLVLVILVLICCGPCDKFYVRFW